MVPMRYAFRNRWWTLAWAAGICWTAAEFGRSRAHDVKEPDGAAAATAQAENARVDAAMDTLNQLESGNVV